jgi:cell division protein FtsL
MRAAVRKQRRQALRGWIKWVPALAMIFSVLFFDVWLNGQERSRDYENRTLILRERALETEMNALRVRAAELKKFDRLEVMAEELGLQEPKPDQVRIVRYVPGKTPVMEETMAVAALHQESGDRNLIPTARD